MSARLLWPGLEAPGEAAGWLAEYPKVTTAQVLTAIARRHPMDGFNGMPGRWVFAREVQAATGSYADSQRFDALAVGLVPSTKYARVVYEVKVSRADWLREMRPIPDVRETIGSRKVRMDPRRARRVVASMTEGEADAEGYFGFQRWYQVVGEYHKWDAALEVSTEFWVAAPPRCVQVEELPPEAGLLEVRPWGPSGELRPRVIRPAPVRDTPVPGQAFWAAFLRRALERPA